MGAMDAIKSFKRLYSNFIDKPVLDNDTFIDIYESYYKKVYNYISYRINNQSDVDEMVSSVFETVIRKYPTYRADRAPLEAWIIGIAKIVVADYFRSIKKYVFISIDTVTDINSNNDQPDEIAIVNEENAELLKALSVLSDKERNIMSMKFATDLKNSEIAELTGLSKTLQLRFLIYLLLYIRFLDFLLKPKSLHFRRIYSKHAFIYGIIDENTS